MHGTTCSVAVITTLLVYGIPLRSAEPGTEVPFDLYQRHLVVTKGAIGPLNGLNLLIDTGTIPSVVDSRIARKLRLQTGPAQLGVAFGQQVSIQSAVLNGIDIGSLRSGPVPAAVGDLSYLRGVQVDAIVGLDVLARSSFSIDYRTRRLRFAPEGREESVAPLELAWPFLTVRDGHRRPANAIAGRYRQSGPRVVQDADAPCTFESPLERRQDCELRLRCRAPAATRAATRGPWTEHLGHSASLVARPRDCRISAGYRRRAGCDRPRLPARQVRFREGRVRLDPVNLLV